MQGESTCPQATPPPKGALSLCQRARRSRFNRRAQKAPALFTGASVFYAENNLPLRFCRGGGSRFLVLNHRRRLNRLR
jgi:hypothetical protein